MAWFYITERDKQIILALVTLVGVILFWRGLWGIADNTPIIENFFVSLFIGLVVLLLTGVIFTQGSAKASVYKANRFIRGLMRKHPKHQHKNIIVHFHDKLHKKVRRFKLHEIEDMEKNFLIIKFKRREYIIPANRIKKIVKGKEVLWEK